MREKGEGKVSGAVPWDKRGWGWGCLMGELASVGAGQFGPEMGKEGAVGRGGGITVLIGWNKRFRLTFDLDLGNS